MAKPLIFLAAVGATFNRHLVDTARVVSSRSSANIAFPTARCVRECRPAWNFPRSPPSGLPPRPSLFAADVSRWNRKRARRHPAAADGLNNRRRENELERKKKKKKSASLRESVIHRDIAESLLTEVSMIPAGERFNSCPDDYVRGWTAPARADTRVNRELAWLSMYFQYRDKAI